MSPMSQDSTFAHEDLARRFAEASPELMVVMLLDAGQRFLAQAVDAMGRKDFVAKGAAVSRVSAIIEELALRLNHKEGGELVENLVLVYQWWSSELLQASGSQQPARLEQIARSMGELKEAWQQVHARQSAAPAPGGRLPDFSAGAAPA